MQTFCTHKDSCIHFFPGMGYRPAAFATQRDQYGDHAILVVGDDSPVEGKLSSQWTMTDLPVDPYAHLVGIPATALLRPAVFASSGIPGTVPPNWGGGSGWPGGPSGTTPGNPLPGWPPISGDSSEPPSNGDTSTLPPGGADLPPLQPVPGPEAGILLLSAMVILTVVQASKRALRGG